MNMDRRGFLVALGRAFLSDTYYLLRASLRRLRWLCWEIFYVLLVIFTYPLQIILALLLKNRVRPNSVIHISQLGHVPWNMVETMRASGIDAKYVSVGENRHWTKSDFHLRRRRFPFTTFARDVHFFWTEIVQNSVYHSHFMRTLSPYHWELPLLRLMGRRVVVHFRGCEARDEDVNINLHPQMNICQSCDYAPKVCRRRDNRLRRKLVRKLADIILVTTPDMKDFFPEAQVGGFFLPVDLLTREPPEKQAFGPGRDLCIVHATNHPGIEGTLEISRAIAKLSREGWNIKFKFLRNIPPEQVLEELETADLNIGKMKMGHYANTQIEAMALGVPAITHVRPEFISDELTESGFIFSTLGSLEDDLRALLTSPELLEQKRLIARSSILKLHDQDRLLKEYAGYYGWT